jgi:hypothetical protein
MPAALKLLGATKVLRQMKLPGARLFCRERSA